MRTAKKLISMFLIICMCLAFVSPYASAADDGEYEIIFLHENGTPLSRAYYNYGDTVEIPTPSKKYPPSSTKIYRFVGWNPEVTPVTSDVTYEPVYELVTGGVWGSAWLLSDDGVLTIGKVGTIHDTTSSPSSSTAPWLQYKDVITSVVINDGVEAIPEAAFDGCTNLVSVTVPDSVTTISKFAFRNCTNLKTIDIPEGLTKLGQGAFLGCTSLPSVEIPSGVITIDYQAFYGCTGLETLVINDGVQNIGEQAFENCTSLLAVDMPDSVVNVNIQTFKGCTSLESVRVSPSLNMMLMGNFQNCTSLTEVIIPESQTPLMIGLFVFDGCTSLESITIPSNVTQIGQNAFTELKEGSKIYTPNSSFFDDGYNYTADRTTIIGTPYTLTLYAEDGETFISEESGIAYDKTVNLPSEYLWEIDGVQTTRFVKGETADNFVTLTAISRLESEAPDDATSSEVTLTVEPSVFSVTVPMVLPVAIDANGNITVADNLVIVNYSVGPVIVTSITIDIADGWSLVDYDSDFAAMPIDTDVFGLQLMGNNVSDADEYDVSSLEQINGSSSVDFTYDVKLTPRTMETEENIANVILTVGWSE